jgi:hypothetical protein
MLEVEPMIVAELDRLAADPVADSDWMDVLARAETPFGFRKQRVILLAAATLVALAVAAVAIAASFGGFRTWLTGEPGNPASATAQAAFDRATRGWRGFPHSTSLRQLISTDVDGVHYELDGFRGAGSLCVRLIASGSATASRLSCAPLAELRSSRAPALVLAADSSVGDSGRKVTEGPLTFREPQAAVTFGVVADGVDRIRVTHQRPAATRTYVSGDAFLAVSPRLSPFNATATIVAAAAGGTKARVPFVRGGTPFSRPPPIALPSPRGPANVQRHVTGGTIRWFARRKPRGTALPQGLHHTIATSNNAIFARVISPDPAAPERMIVSISSAGNRYFNGHLRNNRQVCTELIGGRYQGGGCWPAGRLFSTEPFTSGVEVQQGGQVMTITGLAADSAARLRLFTAIGGVRSIPLHDNGYIAAATIADFPVRLVAYDANGLIIGTKTIQGAFAALQPFPSPAPGAHWTEVLHNRSGSVWTIRSTTGGLCIAFRVGGGVGAGCGDWSVTPSSLHVSVGSDRSHSYVEGIAGSRITTIRLTLRSGRTIVVSPIHRYVLYRLAQSALRDPSAAVKTIEGLASDGTVLAHQHQ